MGKISPTHRCPTLGGRLLLVLASGPGLVALAPLCGRNECTMFAVGRKHPVKAGQVNSWLGHQGRQSSHEVHGFEDDVRGAVAVRGLTRLKSVVSRVSLQGPSGQNHRRLRRRAGSMPGPYSPGLFRTISESHGDFAGYREWCLN